MSKNRKVCLLSKTYCQYTTINGMMSIGGEKSSGIKLEALKNSDDYVIVSPCDAGLKVISLLGRDKKTTEVKELEPITINDLTLFLMPEQQSISDIEDQGFYDDFLSTLDNFSSKKDLNSSLVQLIQLLINSFSMEKGLVVAKDESKQLKLMASINVPENEPWLSKTLVLQTVQTQKAIFIKNIIGSHFESSKSLIATGFISVCSWPLTIRGQTLGAIVVASDKPHSGLSIKQEKQAQAYVQLVALVLKFYLNDIKLKEEVAALRNSLKQDGPLSSIDPHLQKTSQLAQQVANTDLSILIQGETGVGKEVMARWLHENSDRKNGPFIAVNCGAIPSELLESLLFGHIKGSFTGAIKDQKGKFVLANRGTIFLDEIGDLPEKLQVKLLRALQERVVEPLGSHEEVPIDIRIIAASHKDIEKSVATEKFREDLFYRLAEVHLDIPPLRDRPADIEVLATKFLLEFDPNKSFSTEAWRWLKAQTWKGNVRELKTTIKRASILCHTDEIDVEHFQMGRAGKSNSNLNQSWLGGSNLDEAKNNFVTEKVKKALQISSNNKTEAAKLLGVAPRTLFRYLENFDL